MPGANYNLSRRTFMLAGLGTGSLLVLGCSPSTDESAEVPVPAKGAGSPPSPLKAAMTVHRDPNCGCCESWAQTAKEAGYQVTVLNEADMAAIKQRHGVPTDLASCHTTLVDGLVVEGHVPMEDVERLINARPEGIKGIAVPGMPLGSPGMEMPDGTKQTYDVIAFDASGRTSVFASHGKA